MVKDRFGFGFEAETQYELDELMAANGLIHAGMVYNDNDRMTCTCGRKGIAILTKAAVGGYWVVCTHDSRTEERHTCPTFSICQTCY